MHLDPSPLVAPQADCHSRVRAPQACGDERQYQGMAGTGFNYGSSTGGGGFLGLEQKYVAGIIVAALLAVAILGAAFLMRPKPAAPTADPREVACIQSGGTWYGSVCSHLVAGS